MTDAERIIRHRARGDADSLDLERPPWSSVLEVARDLAAEDESDEFLAAVAALGEERASAIYFDEWSAIEREATGDQP